MQVITGVVIGRKKRQFGKEITSVNRMGWDEVDDKDEERASTGMKSKNDVR